MRILRRMTVVCALALAGVTSTAQAASPVLETAGCKATTLPATDDGSSGPIALPFTVNFYGLQRSRLWVNNNGSVSFDMARGTSNPFPVGGTIAEIAAPFLADVDTRRAASADVTYGMTTFDGRPAFCATWGGTGGVGYYSNHVDKLNRFQVLIVNRGDVTAGAFDIAFNYEQIQWETGDGSGGVGGLGGRSARAGFSNGTGDPGTGFELVGSGVNGAFLDGGPRSLSASSYGTTVLGRHIYEVRNDVVSADNPFLWLRLGETSGTSMRGEGGQGGYYQNGVVLGQPGALVGNTNTAALFNGLAAHGYINGVTAPTQAYTMEVWAKPGAPKQAGTMVDHGGSGALYMETNRFCFRQTTTAICGAGPLTSGDWYHVAGTWDTVSDRARLYVNGVEVASAVIPGTPSGSNTLYVGYGSSAPWFKGTLDEAVYYRTALPAGRIGAHYHTGCAC